ncbi:hypothetical protein HY251_01030 [bacterium]|nr:hypothetical protein [bacterium]
MFVVSHEVARAIAPTREERRFLLPWAAPSEVPAFPDRPRSTRKILYLAGLEAPPPGRLLRHLERFRPALDRRRETERGVRPWFELHWPRERALFSGPRVLLPRMFARPRACYVERDLVVGESVLVLRTADAASARLAAALLCTAPLAEWLLARAKRRGVGVDVSVALAREIPWPRALVSRDLARVEPVARALERGDRRAADEAARALYR